jgi:hypothetical protein
LADAKQLIDVAERPLLAASVLAVLVYLGELAGVWTAWGVAEPVHLLALGLDVAFLIDLGAKLLVERRDYVRGPWFVVDLVCALPILATVGAPPALEGLRFVRMFRLLRALRLLRSLRTLRLLRLFDYTVGETLETRRFDAVLRVSVLAYAATFVALVQVARERVTAPAFGADELELWFVFGSLLGMALLLLLSQYQIPAVFSRQVRALLNVALPHQVADWFLAHPDAYDQDTRGPATVVFCRGGLDSEVLANRLYRRTGREIVGSYFAKGPQGEVVRVDGGDAVDAWFFESRGFVPVSEPVKEVC